MYFKSIITLQISYISTLKVLKQGPQKGVDCVGSLQADQIKHELLDGKSQREELY